ncbi:hypothetical protein Y88_0803 [Novosphingobium nitrogenifigens DSM 19370]|uniref:Uncharacterized protein n=1 Tax=Novosphingobium nitrogenifigens DSM 19370 TaxID=983920 RepID=F1Z9J7_9SPHN|nr:hypothetical protein [Novosphingobium nitrogenifigens]EGD58745.1 hypothetical protein Y88_0803 [Novosphingobium nitrogenifigens DSM 19370]
MLERLVVLAPGRLLDDETVARVRALAHDVARQLAGMAGRAGDPQFLTMLAGMVAGNRALLLHFHALALEWRQGEVLARSRGLDPVLSPLLRRRLDAGAMVPDASALLAAQARTVEALRRMHLPLSELPADLHRMAIAILQGACAVAGDDGKVVAMAPITHDEHGTRLALVRRFLDGLGEEITSALCLGDAGLAVFLTALAIAAGQPREVVAIAMAEDDALRLALILRAAGLESGQAAAQLLILRPEADPALVQGPRDARDAEGRLGECAALHAGAVE